MKVAKPRFNIGDTFKYDGSTWTIRFMYILAKEPSIWYHMLEENHEPDIITILTAGMGAKEKREWTPFANHREANTNYSQIYANGDRTVKTTQELLALSRV